MQQVKLWLLAAILVICGATLLTSCSNDDTPITPEQERQHTEAVGELIRLMDCNPEVKALLETNLVKEAGNQELLDILARSLYEMAAVNVMANLLLMDASRAPELFANSAKVYVNLVESEVEKHFKFINSFKAEDLEAYKKS